MLTGKERLEEVIYFVIERTSKRLKQYSMMEFQKHGFELTIDQWIVLKRIGEQEGINQIDLAESTYKDPASITRILDALIKKGWVEKRVNEHDRRRFDLLLTQSGRDLHNEMIEVVVELRKVGIEGMSLEEIALLEKLLNKIFKNVDSRMK